jgi:hypothetical protein
VARVADDGGEARVASPGDEDVEAAGRRLAELADAYGPEDHGAVAAAESLAMLHYARQETAAALPLMRRVVRSGAAVDAATTLRRRRLLVGLLQRSGEYAEALVEHDRVVAATVAAAGAQPREALASRYNHAVLLRDAGAADRAAALFAEIADQAARAHGPDDVVARAAADRMG